MIFSAIKDFRVCQQAAEVSQIHVIETILVKLTSKFAISDK